MNEQVTWVQGAKDPYAGERQTSRTPSHSTAKRIAALKPQEALEELKSNHMVPGNTSLARVQIAQHRLGEIGTRDISFSTYTGWRNDILFMEWKPVWHSDSDEHGYLLREDQTRLTGFSNDELLAIKELQQAYQRIRRGQGVDPPAGRAVTRLKRMGYVTPNPEVANKPWLAATLATWSNEERLVTVGKKLIFFYEVIVGREDQSFPSDKEIEQVFLGDSEKTKVAKRFKGQAIEGEQSTDVECKAHFKVKNGSVEMKVQSGAGAMDWIPVIGGTVSAMIGGIGLIYLGGKLSLRIGRVVPLFT